MLTASAVTQPGLSAAGLRPVHMGSRSRISVNRVPTKLGSSTSLARSHPSKKMTISAVAEADKMYSYDNTAATIIVDNDSDPTSTLIVLKGNNRPGKRENPCNLRSFRVNYGSVYSAESKLH